MAKSQLPAAPSLDGHGSHGPLVDSDTRQPFLPGCGTGTVREGHDKNTITRTPPNDANLKPEWRCDAYPADSVVPPCFSVPPSAAAAARRRRHRRLAKEKVNLVKIGWSNCSTLKMLERLEVAKSVKRRSSAGNDNPISISESPLRQKDVSSRFAVDSASVFANSTSSTSNQPNEAQVPFGLQEADSLPQNSISRSRPNEFVLHTNIPNDGMDLYSSSSRSLPHASIPPILFPVMSDRSAHIPGDNDMRAILSQLKVFQAR
jgi:hypothetical protein